MARHDSPRSERRLPAGLAARLVFALALLAALGGCLEEASDKSFKFDNENDTTTKGGDDQTGVIAIALVMDLNDIVIIVNQGVADKDLTGWTLENATGTAKFTIPSFELKIAQFVRVHTNVSGTDTASDLFANAGETINWGGIDTNSVVLRDDSRSPVAQCDNGDPCWP
jgi:hypothetical protein